MFFPVCTPAELDTKTFLPVSTLISSDTSGLLVPLYPRAECPEAARFDIATYVAGWTRGSYFVPIHSSTQPMMTRARPVSAITAGGGS